MAAETEKKEKRWVLVFDRDKTLAPSHDAPIPESVRIMLRELEKIGCIIVVSTGKPLSVAQGSVAELALKEPHVIGENGIDMYWGESLFPPVNKKTIGLTEEKKKLLSALREEMKEKFAKDAETGNGWFQPNNYNASCSYMKGQYRDMDLRQRLIDFFTEKKKLPEYADFDIYMHVDCIEMVAGGVNKGTAIRELHSMYPDYNIATFGDGMNDFPMFEESRKIGGDAYGIKLKKEDEYRVNSNHENVFGAIEKFIEKNINNPKALNMFKNLKQNVEESFNQVEKKYYEKVSGYFRQKQINPNNVTRFRSSQKGVVRENSEPADSEIHINGLMEERNEAGGKPILSGKPWRFSKTDSK